MVVLFLAVAGLWSGASGRGVMISGVRDQWACGIARGRLGFVDFSQIGGDIDYDLGGRQRPASMRIGGFSDSPYQSSERLGLWTLDPIQGDFFIQAAAACYPTLPLVGLGLSAPCPECGRAGGST